MLMELLFWRTSVLLVVDNTADIVINDCHYKFAKMFVAHITLPHPCLVKIHKNVTEHLTSSTVSAQIFLALWTLNPG